MRTWELERHRGSPDISAGKRTAGGDVQRTTGVIDGESDVLFLEARTLRRHAVADRNDAGIIDLLECGNRLDRLRRVDGQLASASTQFTP